MGSYARLLSSPAPRRLALAAIPADFADFADWLDYAGVVGLLVFVRGEGPLALALLAVALSLPYVVVGPLLAVLVDKSPIRRVLVASNLGRAVATLLLILAPSTALVLIVVFARGCVDSAFTPARAAAIQATTPREQLAAANGLHQAINQLSKIVGPGIGGLWIAALPIETLFAANAVLSLAAAAIAATLTIPDRPPSATAPAGFWHEVAAGAAEFRNNRRLRAALLFACVAFFSMFLYDALIALLAAELGLGATVFGLSIGASGLGGLVGALAAGQWSAARPVAWMAAMGVVGGLAILVFAAAVLAGVEVGAPAFLVALAVMGGTSGAMLVPYRTIVQLEAAPERLARVFAAGEAATTVVIITAPFVGSAIAGTLGTAAAFLVGGLVRLGLGLATPFIPGLR